MAIIYVIEDDASLRAELTCLLEREGYETVSCDDFAHAAVCALATAPDLVLLDLTLPATDGQLICREIRAASSVPIIVLTSRVTETDEVASIALGADDFVAKPLRARVLIAHIEAVLRRAGISTNTRLSCGALTLDLARSQAWADGRGGGTRGLGERSVAERGADGWGRRGADGREERCPGAWCEDLPTWRPSSALSLSRREERCPGAWCEGDSGAVSQGGERAVDLTKNEARILALLMRRSPAIVGRDELMRELWDTGEFVDDNTLTVNVNRLRTTLGRIGMRGLIVTHRGQGYSL